LLTWARLASKYSIAYSRKPLAVFWMPATIVERKGRFDDKIDVVGIELEKLYQNSKADCREGLRKYLALWHRMRAVSFLQTGKRINCLKSIRLSISFGGVNTKLVFIGLVSILPYPNPGGLFQTLKKAIEIRRLGKNHVE